MPPIVCVCVIYHLQFLCLVLLVNIIMLLLILSFIMKIMYEQWTLHVNMEDERTKEG